MRKVSLKNDTLVEYFALRGGLNLESPPLAIPAGNLIDVWNYEALPQGGYRRVKGYERFDGQSTAHDKSYWILSYTVGNGTQPVAGDSITGDTSLDTAEVVVVTVDTGTSWAGGDATGNLILYLADGVFQDAEGLTFAAATATANGIAAVNSETDDALHAAYKGAAIEQHRAKILAVPTTVVGTAPVNGVLVAHTGEKYAIRDYDGSEARMYKATTAGWVLVDLGDELAFTAGTDIVLPKGFSEQEIITANTGGTATVERVSVSDIDWDGGNATGTLTVSGDLVTNWAGAVSITGGTSGATATVSGIPTAIALPLGGRYEFIVRNFYANADAERAYGVNGVGKAFEFDYVNNVFCYIQTGNTTDTPEHIEEHYKCLFLSYPNGSLQHATPGSPLDWGSDPFEIGAGNAITGILSQPGGTLGIFSRDKTSILHGDGDPANWDLKALSEESGAIEWTISNIGGSRYLDDRGVTSLVAVQSFGDFRSAVISQNVERLLESKRELAVAGEAFHQKNQYRLFFSDKTGLIFTFNADKLVGITLFRYEDDISCTHNGQESTGSEAIFFGSSDGYVYKFDEGNSFDDSEVVATFSTAFTHLGRPASRKRFRKITVEVEADSETTITYQPQFDYGSSLIAIEASQSVEIPASGTNWNAANWGEFTWASDSVTLLEGNITGEARNISVAISSTSTYDAPHTLYGMIINYSPRRLLR